MRRQVYRYNFMVLVVLNKVDVNIATIVGGYDLS